jgi:glycosyltransferase involved in cell wall biosynthesis
MNKILMIGPEAGKNNGGGVASYIKSIIPILEKENTIKRINTMTDLSLSKRVFDFILAIIQTILYSINNKNTIAHIHMASRWSFKRKSLLIKILKFRKIPIILHLHGGEFHIFFEKESSTEIKRKITNTFLACDEVIALSNSWAKWIKENIKHPSVNMIFNGSKDYLIKDDFVSKRENLLLFMGRIGERKGIFDLIESLNTLNTKFYDFKLIIAGDGEITKAKELVSKYKLEDKIIFTGWIGEEQKIELLNKSKIFILPSYNEGMPIGILEAMSAKLPVISTYVGGIPETVIESETGLLFETGDKETLENHILQILNNNDLCDKFSKNSRKRYLDNFSLDSVCNQLNNLYKKLGNKHER